MKGFFTLQETQSESRPDGKNYSCITCGLLKHCQSPKMKPYGNFQKGIMNIGMFPGEADDDAGKPFQGKAGRVLKRAYQKLGVDLFEDCININAIRCHPNDKGRSRLPTPNEIACCRKSVLQHIKEYQPKVIMVFGNAPLQSILQHRWKGDLGTMHKWRGWQIPDQDFKAWVCPMYDPEFVSTESRQEINTIWQQDLERALYCVVKAFPRDSTPEIEIVDTLDCLEGKRPQNGLISFDYETTGIKPHATGHRIICASVADTENHCWAFMMPATKKARQPFLTWLTDPTIGKMAHNMKFEDHWTKIRLKTEVDGWQWDSMQAAHLLDNRPNVTGLKFQTYVNFGVVDYASEVSPYLQSKSKDDGANGINQIEKLIGLPGGEKKLLTYCGMDTIYQYRLAMKQINEINYSFLPF